VARKGIEHLEDLQGKRLGVSSIPGNTGFVALLLAERMRWDPIHDISILVKGNTIDAIREDRVDAIVANERSYATALAEGYPILAATSTWEAPLAGNSVMVRPEWFEDPRNLEAVRRFLKATIEGIALFHQDRELTLEVLAKWHGITDRAYAETIYDSGQWIPQKPYPCHEGIIKAMERYDSNEMRRFTPEDFYDDSLIRELDESGFIDDLYATAEWKSP
jgi:ABC-type nitrate/sulfonate/bicarbonate transport system substrate-binding protein